ncbi:MAG: ABC transporter ATP-binding protein/permease [bacterium]|nr:ABC transporter ATP-binding protein/permease [bacterium]
MKKALANVRRILIIFKPFRKEFGIILGLLAFVETLSLSTPYFLGKVINALNEGKPVLYDLTLAFTTLSISLAALLIANWKDVYELKNVDFHIPKYLESITRTKILGLSIGQHKSQNSGITQSVISRGQSSLEQIVRQMLYTVLPICTRILITMSLLIYFNISVGLIVLLGTSIYVRMAFGDNLKYWSEIKSLINLNHRTSKHSSEILRNSSLVQVHSQEKRVGVEQDKRLDGVITAGMGVWVPYHEKAKYKHILVIFLRFIVLVIGIFQVKNQGYKVGDLMIMMAWTNQITSELWMVGRLQRQMMDLWGHVQKYFAILDVEPAVKVVTNPIRVNNFSGRVEFRDIGFTYNSQRYIDTDDGLLITKPESEKEPALSNVNFTIEEGQCVAFVGESGAGKSTIINLLVRGHDPDSGQIFIDGHDLRLIDLKHFRESIGLVEQNVTLFDNTLRYNILFGLNGRGENFETQDLEKVARESCIDRFSSRLQDGWDTFIGENGVELSGGERQRVGIARALIKEPRLLILDEATSSLDALNESLIKEAVRNASRDRTTIIIAHRLSTVRDVDKIFVMSKGTVVATGTHMDLLSSSPLYRELVEKQLFQA